MTLTWWGQRYAAAKTRQQQAYVIIVHRRVWFSECGCWPSQKEQARQLGCSNYTISMVLKEFRR